MNTPRSTRQVIPPLEERRAREGEIKNVQKIANNLLEGDRRALAKAITLVESTRARDQRLAQRLIKYCLARTGNSIRIGLSGVPGVGKSTFIESFGMHLINEGHRVAVLAVDPSSQVTGGSILGDKTRMQRLSGSPEAFIRPSPSRGTLGGVTTRTRECILLCEAAGYDRIIVETVGVGQSEVDVASMTDIYMLLMLPNAGDELQGIKKGILELADLIAVNKVDTDKQAALRTSAQLKSAMHLMRPRTPNWTIPILPCSALNDTGMAEIEAVIQEFTEQTGGDSEDGIKSNRRRAQSREWMWSQAREQILNRFMTDEITKKVSGLLEERVFQGKSTPTMAADKLIQAFLKKGWVSR